MKASRLIAVVVLGVIFIAAGVYVAQTANVFPVQASADAPKVDTLFNVMLGIATVIFLIVEVGIILSIILFRHRKGDEGDGPPEHGNTALEVTWTAIPAVIVFALSVYSYQVFADMQAPKDNETAIGVTGQQFAWSFTYAFQETPVLDECSKLTPAQIDFAKQNMFANSLELPVGRPIRMEINAKDVMHGFYIPEFRIKQDAIPGKTTIARFTPTLKGNYNVVCTELCGQGHATMHNSILVVDPSEYDNFVHDLQKKACEAAGNPRLPERGKQLMSKYGCSGCHTLTDAGFAGTVGPKLDGIATRAENNEANRLTDSGAADAAEYIRLSIINPGLYIVAPFQNLMPKNFGDPTVMSEDDREAIINYLLTQK